MIDGKVYSRFLLHGTETGRLSSRDPNLQNITQGELRGIFTASNPEGVLSSADYRAIELRVAALELGSPWLLQAFREERNIHAEVATQLFGPTYTDGQYRHGKTVTFGIFYDRQAPAIASALKISVPAAQRMINRWKERVPELDLYFQKTRNEIILNSYLRSKFGRLRRFWLINEDNRLDVYREGYNFKIQSPAGDITTRSIIRIDKELPELKSIITVHDSITFDIDDASQVEEIQKEVERIMTDNPDFDIPTPVDWKVGYRWS
jgi:DNA polymerase-1